jgi:hypothetical protein
VRYSLGASLIIWRTGKPSEENSSSKISDVVEHPWPNGVKEKRKQFRETKQIQQLIFNKSFAVLDTTLASYSCVVEHVFSSFVLQDVS